MAVSKVLYSVPVIDWRRGPNTPPVTVLPPAGGVRRSWATNLDGLTLWHFSGPRTPPPVPLGGPGIRGGWHTNLDNYTLWRWQTQHIPRHAGVVGSVVALFRPQPAQSASVVGQVLADFGSLTGGLILAGSGVCVGNVLASFNAAVTNSATVQGQILALFYSHGGQAIGCIAAGEALDATIAPPRNAVH